MARLIFLSIVLWFSPTTWTQVNGNSRAGLRFSNIYGSHMVLQRAPASAVVWGFADAKNQDIEVNMDKIYTTKAFIGVDGSVAWMVKLEPQDRKGPFTITVTSGNETIKLEDVLFGDVWFCSGQSNMYHPVYQLDNADPDLDDAVNYPEVRPFNGGLYESDDPLVEAGKPVRTWSTPDRDVIYNFSAICWLFGKHLYETLKVPIGLVQSAYYGTRIQTWMSQEALDECPSTSGKIPDKEHVVWNAMVYPYLNMTIKGALWYQGESNVGQPKLYECMLDSMITDWRNKWHEYSGSAEPRFPFGVVQLAPWRDSPAVTYYPPMRWAQTAGYGYTPNPTLKDVFLAVSIDLPDFDSPWGSIHPRYKRPIARRLALGAYQLAYNITEYGRYQGPFPTETIATPEGITIIFDDENVQLDKRSDSGFEVCCSETCDNEADWTSVDIISSDKTSVTLSDQCTLTRGIRYLWDESPCPLEKCALYSVENDLPVPPFIISDETHSKH